MALYKSVYYCYYYNYLVCVDPEATVMLDLVGRPKLISESILGLDLWQLWSHFVLTGTLQFAVLHARRVQYTGAGGPKGKPLSRVIIKSALKPAIKAIFFINFDYKMSTRIILSLLNNLCDLICDVIACSVWSCNMGKINASDIMLQNKKKRKYGNKRHFYINQ